MSVPSAPTDVVQAPYTGGTSGTIIINWVAPNDNGGDVVVSHNIYQTVNGVQSLAANVLLADGTTATLTGLTDGSGYTFQVTAVNSIGEGAYSTATDTIVPYQNVHLTLSDMSQTYTGSPLTITAVADVSGVPISVTYSGNHTDAGSYDISAVVTGNAFMASPVYTQFLILPADATVDVSNLTQAWTGSALQPTIVTNPPGLTTTITYFDSNTDPGICQFNVDISENNYIGSIAGALTITVNASNVSAAIASVNPITSGGLQAVGGAVQLVISQANVAVAAAAAGSSAKISAQAARTNVIKTATAAALASTTTGIQGVQPVGTIPPPAATSYAATASTVIQNITSVDATLASIAATEIITAIQTEAPTLNGTFLTACTTINATKANATDTNATDNASALVVALQEAYPQGNSTVISGADVATLFTNVTTSGTLPTSVNVIVGDNTNTIDMRDTASAYYSPMVPDVSYTLLTVGGYSTSNVVYSAAAQAISVNGTSYELGDLVPLGFQNFELYVIGSAGFAPSTDITLTGVTNVKSGTSTTVSWTVPTLGGITLASVRVTPTINGTAQSPISVYSGTSYTLSNQTVGAVITFAVAMVASDGSRSTSVTSNSVTITSSSSAPCFPKGTPILTPTGYKAVETLEQGSLVLTADGRQVPLKLYGRLLSKASERSAPYFIPKGALGKNMPQTDLTLSPDHAFLLRKGVWMLPSKAATLSAKVQQIGIGEPVHYFHVECPNYLRDNLVVNGATVESYAGKQLDFVSPYKWSESLKGYTRMGEAKAATKSKAAHA